MPTYTRLALVFSLTFCLWSADDPGCPGYPNAMRAEWEGSLALDQAYTAYRKNPNARRSTASYPRDSFIDHLLLTKMGEDGVTPAPITTDTEFVRRVYVDLTGRIPTPEQAEAFFSDSQAGKRAALVSRLVGSPAFVDQFTLFFANKYKVTRGNSNVGLAGRNVFYQFVRDAFQKDRPYNEFIAQMLSASGEVDTVPGAQFFARNIAEDGPIQDTWDNTTDVITTQLLGFKSECVSCHNGRGYLDKINVYLTRKTRAEFWQMSAFLSRMNFLRWSDDTIGFRPRVVVIDRDYGSYSGAVSSAGNRPPRANTNYDPAFFLNGDAPKSGNYRKELARMVTSDRQFARATVNTLFDYFYGHGIVDPPDAWDLARIDPSRPPPAGWPFQNSNPELLEALTDHFIKNNYSIREMARLMTNSTVYQLSSQYPGEWKDAYTRYFARGFARRLTPEEAYDSIITATRTEAPMTVLGWDRPVVYANQLPDPTEPATDGGVTNLLAQFGRGNWMTVANNNGPTLLGLLYSMNDSFVVFRTMGDTRASVVPNNRVSQIHANATSDEDAIRRIFLATLTRYPTEAETATVLAARSGMRDQWLSDLQWALLNKLDFIFNY